jgi:hypothetical protein
MTGSKKAIEENVTLCRDKGQDIEFGPHNNELAIGLKLM